MKKTTILLFVFSLLTLAFLFSYKSGYFFYLSSQGNINPNNLSEEYDSFSTSYIFNNQSFALPRLLAEEPRTANVLGETDAPKRIEIDLTNQRLYAYEGTSQVYNFLVSTGKWGRTPTGVFRLWIKLRYTRMQGGSQALGTYYNMPNVPYTMYFYNDEIPKYRGYGIHGAYWHNNFGHPMSHGCINLKPEDAGLLYYWAKPELPANKQSVTATADNPGTEVIIYGTAPAS